MIRLRAGSATDVGLVRTNNQDRLLVASPLFAVADGMGGAAAGEVASATAIDGLREAFSRSAEASPQTLIEAARAANRAVWEQAEANPEMRGMGTTLVALALVGGTSLAAVNIGDSRLYLLRGDEFRQVTSDHNLVAELVAEGRISKEEAEVHPRRNIMTRALGVDPDVDVDLFVEDPRPGDRYLLCSDGLPRELRDEHMASLLRRLADPQEAAKELVDEAKRRGGNDNITAVVVDVVDDDMVDVVDDDMVDVVDDDTVSGRQAAAATPPGNVAAAASDGGPAPASAATDDQTVASPVVAAEALAHPYPSEPAGPVAPAASPAAPPAKPKARMITIRVVAFFAILLIILALAAAGVSWYARSSYFVGLRGDQVTIFQGRPGGVMWFRPTIASRTNLTTASVLPHEIPKLKAGQEEASLSDARQFVASLASEASAARAAQAAQTTTTVPGAASAATTGPPPTT